MISLHARQTLPRDFGLVDPWTRLCVYVCVCVHGLLWPVWRQLSTVCWRESASESASESAAGPPNIDAFEKNFQPMSTSRRGGMRTKIDGKRSPPVWMGLLPCARRRRFSDPHSYSIPRSPHSPHTIPICSAPRCLSVFALNMSKARLAGRVCIIVGCN